jgi:hypothetical protein
MLPVRTSGEWFLWKVVHRARTTVTQLLGEYINDSIYDILTFYLKPINSS